MEKILGFIGFTDIRSVTLEPTLSEPSAMEKPMAEAVSSARQMAEEF
jgi:FMN-dependent NADH-azoreductase